MHKNLTIPMPVEWHFNRCIFLMQFYHRHHKPFTSLFFRGMAIEVWLRAKRGVTHCSMADLGEDWSIDRENKLPTQQNN